MREKGPHWNRKVVDVRVDTDFLNLILERTVNTKVVEVKGGTDVLDKILERTVDTYNP